MIATSKKPLIIITGPTAVGKSKCSLELAKKVNGEIISADSMQVYKGFDIGTDKMPVSLRQGIPHHMIDILGPNDDFNVKMFKDMSLNIIDEILSRNHIPIVVGGTGFYIQALIKNVEFEENDEDDSCRMRYEALLNEKGPEFLFNLLKEVDLEYTKDLHPNNTKRVIRALSFFETTHTKLSEHNKLQSMNESPFNFAYFVLTNERNVLYERINKRVDEMIKEGLIDEVKGLLENGTKRSSLSMNGIGYRETLDYLDGLIDEEDLKEYIKKETRHFAKRQMTWFRREKDTEIIDKSLFTDDFAIVDYMTEYCKKKNLLIRE